MFQKYQPFSGNELEDISAAVIEINLLENRKDELI
jgi:hypothetical protein